MQMKTKASLIQIVHLYIRSLILIIMSTLKDGDRSRDNRGTSQLQHDDDDDNAEKERRGKRAATIVE